MLVSVAGSMIAGLVLPFGSSRPPPWLAHGGSLDGYFIMKAPIELAQPGFGDSDERREIEMLNSHYRVASVTPMHRAPPRGWRDPALIAALGLDRLWIFELSEPRADLATIVKQYSAVRGVEGVWRDAPVSHCNTPDDTLWPSQWNLQKAKIDCETAWDAATKETVLVSVVDSGADLTHRDLQNNLWTNPGEIAGNGKDDDSNGYVDDVNGWDFWNGDAAPTDDNGHGSHVAGIIGAEGNNARDVAGVCWDAIIQVVKVLDQGGSGTWASISQGLVYAADNGASVVNMSLGGKTGDSAIESAVDYARGLDVVQVAAAGNNASDVPFYPAAYDGVIAVMASDLNDKRPGWSNYGDWCDMLAPGDGVYSLWKSGLTNILSGTSQATPHVTGVAALLRTLNPQLDAVDVEAVIETSCDDLGNPGKDSDYQWGRLNAREAIRRASVVTVEKLSMKPGDSSELYVLDPAFPADIYLLQPTLSGRQPGYTLDFFFNGESRSVPINYDWFTHLAFYAPGIGVFDDFLGVLDGTGAATAQINLPKGNGLSGRVIHFSGFTVDPNDLSKARNVMNSVGIEIQ